MSRLSTVSEEIGTILEGFVTILAGVCSEVVNSFVLVKTAVGMISLFWLLGGGNRSHTDEYNLFRPLFLPAILDTNYYEQMEILSENLLSRPNRLLLGRPDGYGRDNDDSGPLTADFTLFGICSR
jgi:hypothetical protein